MQEPDDHALMISFQERGDSDAFEEIFRRHKGGLHGFLLQLSGDAAVAEEVSQQTWLKLIELAEGRRYRPSAAFRTLLYTMARNRWLDEHVRKARALPMDEVEAEVLELPLDAPDVGELLSRRQGEARLSRALSSLPAEQREVVALWMQGFALVEVAEITGARWHTVVSRKRYALEKLRQALLPAAQEG